MSFHNQLADDNRGLSTMMFPPTKTFGNNDMSNDDFIKKQLAENPNVKKVATSFTPARVVPVPTSTNAPAFKPVSPKQLVETGASSQRVLDLISEFDNPTAILNYGKDVLSTISAKSEALLNEVKDADVDYVETQMRSILTMAKSLHITGSSKGSEGWLTGLVAKVKESFVDTREQLLSEFNNISTQMDRVLNEIEQANLRIIDKVKGLQAQYDSNLQDYRKLEHIINDAQEVLNIKNRDLEKAKEAFAGDALVAQQIARMQSNIDRLEKKVFNLKQFQMMCLQDAPALAQMENNAITLLEKFDSIKTMTIPLWKKQIRMFVDGQELNKAAKLATAVDDANNSMIVANSTANKNNAIETTKLNQRSLVDAATIEQVHDNLISTLDEVLTINSAGKQSRIENSQRMDQMKQLYANIGNTKQLPPTK